MATKLYGYIALYKGQHKEVWAETTLQAQTKASELFKAKKAYMVSVYLCEKPSGEQVVQHID